MGKSFGTKTRDSLLLKTPLLGTINFANGTVIYAHVKQVTIPKTNTRTLNITPIMSVVADKNVEEEMKVRNINNDHIYCFTKKRKKIVEVPFHHMNLCIAALSCHWNVFWMKM